ncbi:NUDIX hydrolase [Maribellus mangrovi]|uniref:NUDIX hydrolase n=1 Tax=Maribellus mangrovi TaxID=3133146 RepID=UPI0030EDF3A6
MQTIQYKFYIFVAYFFNMSFYNIEKILPGHSIDCVVFGFDYNEQELNVLLMKWKMGGKWALPGGVVYKDEILEDAAHRSLKERTGISVSVLEQFHTFSGINRRSEEEIQLMLSIAAKYDIKIEKWFRTRYLTTGFVTVVNMENTTPVEDIYSSECRWVPIKDKPELVMDHDDIFNKAMDHVRIQLSYLPISMALLPEKFTMKALKKVYEGFLGKPLERSNFQSKMLKLDILNRHEKLMTGAANKAPYLYSFDKEKYESLLKKGIGLFV